MGAGGGALICLTVLVTAGWNPHAVQCGTTHVAIAGCQPWQWEATGPTAASSSWWVSEPGASFWASARAWPPAAAWASRLAELGFISAWPKVCLNPTRRQVSWPEFAILLEPHSHFQYGYKKIKGQHTRENSSRLLKSWHSINTLKFFLACTKDITATCLATAFLSSRQAVRLSLLPSHPLSKSQGIKRVRKTHRK